MAENRYLKWLSSRTNSVYWHDSAIVEELDEAMTNGAVVALVNLIAGFFLDKFKAAGMELQGITILRVIAYVMLLYDLTLLLRMKEKPYQRTVEKIKLYDILIKPFREKVYLRTVAIAVLWTFTSGIQSRNSFFSSIQYLHVFIDAKTT